jgi:hypothetical protein
MVTEQETKTDKPADSLTYPEVFIEEDKIVDKIQTYLNREVKRRKTPLPVNRAITLLNRKRFRKVKDLGVLEAGLLDSSITNDNAFKGIFIKGNLLVEVYETNHWENIPNTTDNFTELRFRNTEGTYFSNHCFCGRGNGNNYELEGLN